MTEVVKDGLTPDPCSDPPCNRALMVSLSPLHPRRYLNMACDLHRQVFVESSPSLADYQPKNWRAL